MTSFQEIRNPHDKDNDSGQSTISNQSINLTQISSTPTFNRQIIPTTSRNNYLVQLQTASKKQLPPLNLILSPICRHPSRIAIGFNSATNYPQNPHLLALLVTPIQLKPTRLQSQTSIKHSIVSSLANPPDLFSCDRDRFRRQTIREAFYRHRRSNPPATSEDQEHSHMQSLDTIPDSHVTDKLANRLYDRISANGWPKLGGYPIVKGWHEMPANHELGKLDNGSIARLFWHEQPLEATWRVSQSWDFCGGGW